MGNICYTFRQGRILMELELSDQEKLLFEKIRNIREFCMESSSIQEEYLDRLLIKNILFNLLERRGIRPVNAAFDALTDDINCYLHQSFDEFVGFLFDYRHLRQKDK